MNDISQVAANQAWLDPAAEGLASAVRGAFHGARGALVKDGLNGVWLRHPLHPAITDIPIGAWTMAQVFDAIDATTDSNRYEDAAQVCITTGLVGAVGAAMTGLTDWSDTGGGSRRLGLIHGLMNLSATGLFLTSAPMRRRGRSRGAGGFTRTIRAADLHDGDKQKVKVGEAAVVLIRQGDQVFAMADRCAHQGGPLSEGDVRDDVIICPWHRSQYDIRTGEVVHGPSTFDQPCYTTRIVDGFVEVRPRSAS
jgi:nitrite reductase/ring-hydroxylating ferredoxin subunit